MIAIDTLIEVISKSYYSKIPFNEISSEIKNYYTCRFETYKTKNNIKKSEDFALVDTVEYFSKQNRVEWNPN